MTENSKKARNNIYVSYVIYWVCLSSTLVQIRALDLSLPNGSFPTELKSPDTCHVLDVKTKVDISTDDLLRVIVEYPIWLWAQDFIVIVYNSISQAVSRPGSQHPDSASQGRTWLA